MADTRIDELRRRLERDPGSRLFAQLAEELRKSGELAEAIQVARAGLPQHPLYASARLTLGRALLDSGDPAAARAELEAALRDAPDNILASRFLAQAREELGDLGGAAEQYRRTLLMAPGDRQLQGQLAALEARLSAPAGAPSAGGAKATPPEPRGAPPPRQPGAATAEVAAPPVVFAPSRPLAPTVAEAAGEGLGESAELPATLRIRSSQGAAPPAPPRAAQPAPQRAPAPVSASETGPAAVTPPGTDQHTWFAASEAPARDTAVSEAAAAAARPETTATPGEGAEPAPAEGVAGSPAPFSSSTLAELYFQQGLLDRARDVYGQVLEQDPGNEKARGRLAELAGATPAAEERAVRRRSLERTIAGLETLLEAVRRR